MNDKEIKAIEALTKEISILNRLFAFYLEKTLRYPDEPNEVEEILNERTNR